MRQIRIGKIVLTDGGEWNISSTYAKLTWVLHNGDAWWSTVNNVASEPADTNPAWVRATSVQRFIQAIQTAIADADSLTKDVEKAEQLRQDAENLRIAKEEQRNKDNAAYKAAEGARQKEELHREENEKLRVDNEKQRIEDFADFLQQCASQYIEAEADRDTAFAEAEAARSRGEQNRVYAEGERVNSETIRQQTFERAMTDAGTATQLAEETAAHPTYIGEDFYVYVWDSGTKAYSKTNIFVKGEGFSISKTYPSVAEMEADSANITPGSFVLISNDNTEDPDNAKLYVKDSGVFRFLVDMSGAIGFTGKTPQLEIGTVTNGGNMGAASASIVRTGTDTDGNPTYAINLALPMVSYDDLTEAQKKDLQKPATDMIATLEATNEAVKTEEAKRVESESGRVAEWNTIKENATSSTSAANDAAILANSKAALADTAASNANENASLADTAASNANEKAGYAQEQGNYAKEQGDALVNFTETVERSKSTEASLNSLIKNMEEQGHVHAQSLDVDAIPTICGFPLIKIRDEDPNVTPDFIGQFWINKTGGTVYIATHCNSAAGYKAI